MNGQTMRHTTRFPIAMSFATMLALGTVFGAAAQNTSAPDTITAATAERARSVSVQAVEVQSDRDEQLMSRQNSPARGEIGSPSRFNRTIDYGE